MNEIMKLTKGFLMLPYAAPNRPASHAVIKDFKNNEFDP